MDETYLIEIRLARTKWRVKEIISAIARVHNLTDLMERHPHLTLYGPLTLNVGTGEDLLLGTVERVASRYGPVPFTIGGFEKREGMHGSVVAFSVKPSVSLRALAKEIAGAVSPLSVSQNAWDAVHDHKWYHVTVANRLDRPAAAAVYDALCPAREPCSGPAPSGPGQAVPAWQDPGTGRIKPRISPLLIDEAGLRITVMRGEEILAEYDLPGKRWITGSDIYDGRAWQETLALYRRSAGFETAGRPAGDRKDIFFIGDLHLGHANIIRYCSRPFSPSDPGEMDRVLIANWNSVVPPENHVFFLGDLCYGPGARPAKEYLAKLNGRVAIIRGNHDIAIPESVRSAELSYGGIRFFITHDPADAPKDFDGWVIHGHHHNNSLAQYPFISFGHRRINVSAETLGYVPITLRELCARIGDSGGLETPPVLLRYPYVR